MAKLSQASLDKLRSAFAKGKLPESGDPGYNDFYDIFNDLCEGLADEWAKPKVSQTRRHIAALLDVWTAIQCDGLLVGIACNQPEIVTIARDAAESMKLEILDRHFAQVEECIPPAVLRMKDPGKRLEWYDSDNGQEFVERLDRLEEETQEYAYGDELMEGCIRRVLAEPGEFFKS